MRLQHDPAWMQRVSAAEHFGRVAVLAGGDSSERAISLLSGAAVLEALKRRAVAAEAFDPSERALSELRAARIDRVWIALHGPGGEDGTVQGALEWLGVPYTGSGVMGSAIGMDKLRTKRLAKAIGVASPAALALGGAEDFELALEQLGLPLIVKPVSQGSSLGMSKVERAEDLPRAYAAARAVERDVFAEAWVGGGEYTVALLQGAALPSIRIETPRVFYDYEAKYLRDRGHRRGRLGPGGLPDGCGRAAAAARDQHRARHDRALARADGGARRRDRFRRARLAGARDEPDAADPGSRRRGGQLRPCSSAAANDGRPSMALRAVGRSCAGFSPCSRRARRSGACCGR
jgi:D-alanine--D-alanine ligase